LLFVLSCRALNSSKEESKDVPDEVKAHREKEDQEESALLCGEEDADALSISQVSEVGTGAHVLHDVKYVSPFSL